MKFNLQYTRTHSLYINNLSLSCLILIINICLFFFFSYFLPIRYEENDDVIMCMIANGIYGGIPDCHLVFMNAILGSLLSSLYKLTSTIFVICTHN